MLPLYLSIKGLYSYQARQEIDFTKLTEAGLFGIFGKVGSGKSSILEAISLTLYGETERLNKSDSRGYNMLNLKSDVAEIVFEFLNFNAKKYKIVVNWKRKKKYNEVETISRKAYVWHLEQWLPIDHFEGSELVGLSYENFKRTIIIPQGQFKEFLELKETERSNMMMQVFGLQKYNLYDKTKHLLTENQTALDTVSGQLSTYEDVSEQGIQNLEESCRVYTEKLEQERIVLASKKAAFEQLEAIKTKTAQFILRKQELERMVVLEKEQTEKQQTVLDYTKANEMFSASFSLRDTSRAKLMDLENECLQKATLLSSLVDECKILQHELEALSKEIGQVPMMEQMLREFSIMIELKEKWIDLEKAQMNVGVYSEQVERGQLAHDTQLAALSILKEQMARLKADKKDSDWLIAVSGWYQQYDSLLASLNTLKEEEQLLQQKIVGLEEQIVLSYGNESAAIFYDRAIHEVTIRLGEREAVLSELRVKTALLDFAEHLHDGAACPLCGSLAHPAVITDADTKVLLANVADEVAAIKKELQELTEQKNRGLQLEFQKTDLSQQAHNKVALKESAWQNIETHKKRFIWPEITSKEEFEKIRLNDIQVSIQLKELEQQELKQSNTLAETQTKLEGVKRKLEDFKTQLAEKATRCTMLKENLSEANLIFCESTSVEELQLQSSTLKAKLQRLQERFELVQRSCATKQVEKGVLEGQLTQLTALLEKEKSSLVDLEANIKLKLDSSGFSDEASVQALLQLSASINSWRNEVEQYFADLKVLRTIIAEMEQELQGTVFDEDAYNTLSLEFNAAQEVVEQLLSEFGKVNGQLQSQKGRLAEKTNLSKSFEAISNRHQSIEKLINLFKGNGFVNYVSSIYLEQLAAAANQRFHRMTRNQLSLRINDKGDFEVIDYLNNGATRSVKTLSGGQAFQASLCLALALAESVQSAYKQEKNFFFIDEGFGTQDEESTNMVYETLQSLVKENRIVGIISHVGELQERISMSVIVEKDEHSGSQLRLA